MTPKSNLMLVFFVLFSFMFGLRVMQAQKVQSGAQRTVAQTQAVQKQVAPVSAPKSTKVANTIPVPSTTKQYTIQQLYTLINMTNPNKNSHFIVPINGQQVVPDSQCWQTAVVQVKGKAVKKITNLTGSRSAVAAGLAGLINANMGMKVQLKLDTVLLEHLIADDRLDLITKPYYERILLYFVLQGYRFYLIDLLSGKITITARSRINPARNIASKWNYGITA